MKLEDEFQIGVNGYVYGDTYTTLLYKASFYSDVVQRLTSDQKVYGSSTGQVGSFRTVTMPIIITGYCCQGGATIPNDVLCTSNHYCVAVSNAPTPCPAGSFSFNAGNIDPTNCDLYSWVLLLKFWRITGPCSVGYYCPTGPSSSAQANYSCPACHFCPGST